MASILNDLYYGNIIPGDRPLPQTEEYRQCREDWHKKYESLLARLGPEERKLLSWADEADIHCHSLVEADLFAYAFRLGARMMLELLP